MENQKPEEVKRLINLDFRKRGLTHEEAAKLIGYGNKQSLSNILSKKDAYFSTFQAAKFNKAFGYSMKFLMKGEGRLLSDEPIKPGLYSETTPNELLVLDPGASELGLLRLYFRRVIEAWGNPIAKKIYDSYRLLNSCTDLPSMMKIMESIEKNLQALEDEQNNKEIKK